MLLAWRPSAFHWKTPRKSGERRQETKKDSQEQETVVRGQREKILNGQMRDKRFEDKGGKRVQY